MKSIVTLAMLLCCLDASVTASHCYPDYCQNSTGLTSVPGFQCLLTNLQDGECSALTFEGSSHEQPKDDTAKFLLRAYVYKFSKGSVTAFNLTVADANFHSLVTRYHNLLNTSQSACVRLQVRGNDTHLAPQQLFVSCPFSNELYESLPYQLDYLVTGDTYNYSKQYIFNVPEHELFGEGVDVKKYKPFVYVDVSYAPVFSLHVQPLPESYNVTEYRIWLIHNDTGSVVVTNVFFGTSTQDVRYNFTAQTGTSFLKVSAMHSDCGDYGCANSSTPSIIINETSHRLLIMIVSTVWIPPILLYVLYHLYKLYRKESLRRREKPNCLLVYSPARLTHINVMVELAKYLRNCNVAVIDMIDVTDATGKDPEYWCDSAFRSADVVLVVTSPPPKKPAVSLIYQDNDNRLLSLVRENQSQKEKRYYAVHLPYCKPDDLPEEMRHSKRFCLPKELPKLVKVIHKMEHAVCGSVSDKEFLDSVKLAKLEILEEDSNMVKETRETENLLTSESVQSTDNRNHVPEGNVVSQSFATNIDELNLLGEGGGGVGEGGEGGEIFPYESPPSNCVNAFRLDQLPL
ncbi:uncharacterized protein LOC143372700 [Andrena cerasifolii]|uniref:uncharacterized protein LOC143372700 n=1 Tax=Andrena cerasifolii TaxID=2819439 RepID=UPI004037656E